jgi:hypothetical protein
MIDKRDGRCLKPGADGVKEVVVGGAFAGARMLQITACEIFGREPPPGAGLIEHGKGALLARGEDVVLSKAFASERAKLDGHAPPSRALA